MSENIQIRLDNAQKTQIAGESLAKSIYNTPLTILLNGELGAGKTTFLQGFSKGLNISGHLTSPTYALEQIYETPDHGEFLHIDLYRLSPAHGKELIESTDDHKGIRCIEWADRLEKVPSAEHTITIHLKEIDDGKARELEIEFNDIKIPSDKEISEWRNEVMLNKLAIDHCDKVSEVTDKLTNYLLERGIIVRAFAAKQAAALHDLFRFVDFSEEQMSNLKIDLTDEQRKCWEQWKKKFAGKTHEGVAYSFLCEKGFPKIAQIVESHGLKDSYHNPVTIEEKIVHYADKRVSYDKVVTLDERFDDLRKRYQDGKKIAEWETKYEKVRKLEQELFPEGSPF